MVPITIGLGVHCLCVPRQQKPRARRMRVQIRMLVMRLLLRTTDRRNVNAKCNGLMTVARTWHKSLSLNPGTYLCTLFSLSLSFFCNEIALMMTLGQGLDTTSSWGLNDPCMHAWTLILFLFSLTHLHKSIPLRKETCPLWQARKLFVSSSLSLLLLMIEPYFPKVFDIIFWFALLLPSLFLSHCQKILTLFSKGEFCINEWPRTFCMSLLETLPSARVYWQITQTWTLLPVCFLPSSGIPLDSHRLSSWMERWEKNNVRVCQKHCDEAWKLANLLWRSSCFWSNYSNLWKWPQD